MGQLLSGKIEKCHNKNTVVNAAEEKGIIGGIVGYTCNGSEIVNCTNNGNVRGNGYVGGIAGIVLGTESSKISECINSGIVESTGDYVGGISSQVAIVENCTNKRNYKRRWKMHRRYSRNSF